MFKFLALLLTFVVFGFLFLGVFLGRVIRFFGPSDRRKASRKQANRKSEYSKQQDTPQKKFAKSEGEYVNYEEIKDNE